MIVVVSSFVRFSALIEPMSYSVLLPSRRVPSNHPINRNQPVTVVTTSPLGPFITKCMSATPDFILPFTIPRRFAGAPRDLQNLGTTVHNGNSLLVDVRLLPMTTRNDSHLERIRNHIKAADQTERREGKKGDAANREIEGTTRRRKERRTTGADIF